MTKLQTSSSSINDELKTKTEKVIAKVGMINTLHYLIGTIHANGR